jgi:hypothetical protein
MGVNPESSSSGRVRGQVLSVQGLVGAGMRVQLLLPDGRIARATRTDGQGSYSFFDLQAGHYQLRVVDENGKPLALHAQASLDIEPEHGQKPVERTLLLAALAPDHGADAGNLSPAPARIEPPAKIQANGFITGVVTPPQVSVNVRVYNITGTVETSKYVDYLTGAYSVTVQPGTYKVKFEPSFGDYAPEWYDNQRDMTSATPVVVSDSAVRPNINAALDIGGKIAGRITAAGGAPLQYANAYAYTSTTSASWDDVSSDSTDAAGIYTITGLLSGTYYLKFTPPYDTDYLTEYYDNKLTLAEANGVTVALGGVVTGKDAALEIGGKITGQVTAAVGGAPVNNVNVYAYTSTTSTSSSAYDYTDASGLYTITGLLTGTYYLKFDPPYGTDYLTEYYNNKFTLAEANGLNVALGDVRTGIDAALEIGGKITGQVTAAVGGAPLNDVHVYVYTSTTGADWDYVSYVSTDASGVYTITDLMTDYYYLKFDPNGLDYFVQYYNNKPTLASADAVSVTLNNIVPNINAALRSGSKITGRVTAAGNGAPLKDVDVTVYSRRCACDCSFVSVGSATTNASGFYTVTGLLAGSYRVEFDPIRPGVSAVYLGEYYNDKASLSTADPVAVADSSTKSGIDAALALGGQITGRVTATDGGGPLKDVWVSADGINNSYYSSSHTDATGVYTITGLAAGSYRVEFDPSGVSAAYLSEYYNNKSTWGTADIVNVTSGGVTPNINAVLDRGGQITGQVTAADGSAPLEDVKVIVYDSNGNWASVWTNASGVYTTTGLTTGNYRLLFSTQDAYGVTQDYIDEYYNDKSTLAAADVIAVTAPNVVSGKNAVLVRGGKISGRVTASDTGGPLSGIKAGAYDSTGTEVRYDYTDSSGDYVITGLPTGSYRVRFYSICIFLSDSGTIKMYAGEYYNDKPDLATADQVSVTAPGTTSGINAVLAGGPAKFVYLPVVLR